MAEGDDGQEKTEEATPKRKEKAREEGQIITSKEMFVFSGMVMATGMLAIGRGFMPDLAGLWGSYFTFGPTEDLNAVVLTRLGMALKHVIIAGLIVGIPMLAITLLMQGAVGGINFAPKAMAFKANKMDPLKGLKRMVSLKSLVELVKAILKVTLLVSAAAAVLFELLPKIDRMSFMAPGDSAALMGSSIVRVLTALCVGLAIIGAVDLAYQIYNHGKNLKMSRQDLKEESKESEGSPEVKGQIRRRQMEASRKAAQRAQALEDVPLATAIVTNPTHFAVALQYIPGMTPAPVILAMGKGAMAHRIMERGEDADVPILRVPPLARALYYTGDIGMEISEQLYTAVAAILAHVARLDMGEDADLPDVDLPDDLMLDEFGRPMKGAQQ